MPRTTGRSLVLLAVVALIAGVTFARTGCNARRSVAAVQEPLPLGSILNEVDDVRLRGLIPSNAPAHRPPRETAVVTMSARQAAQRLSFEVAPHEYPEAMLQEMPGSKIPRIEVVQADVCLAEIYLGGPILVTNPDGSWSVYEGVEPEVYRALLEATRDP